MIYTIRINIKEGNRVMGKLTNEYLIEGERYSVEIKSSLVLGKVTVTINDEKIVLRSAPFCIKKSEPFKIGSKMCMLKVSAFGRIKIE